MEHIISILKDIITKETRTVEDINQLKDVFECLRELPEQLKTKYFGGKSLPPLDKKLPDISTIDKWFNEHVETTNDHTNNGLPLKDMWLSYSKVPNHCLRKHLKQYLQPYECVSKKRFSDGLSPHNMVYVGLRWKIVRDE